MIVKFTNIKYDTDGVDVKLPTQLVFDDFDDIEDYDFDLEGADYISDFTGFMVESFDYVIVDDYCNHCNTNTPYCRLFHIGQLHGANKLVRASTNSAGCFNAAIAFRGV
jgi:hypothetical protein